MLNLVEGVEHHDNRANSREDVDGDEGQPREVEHNNRDAVDDEEQEATENGALDEVLHGLGNVCQVNFTSLSATLLAVTPS